MLLIKIEKKKKEEKKKKKEKKKQKKKEKNSKMCKRCIFAKLTGLPRSALAVQSTVAKVMAIFMQLYNSILVQVLAFS